MKTLFLCTPNGSNEAVCHHMACTCALSLLECWLVGGAKACSDHMEVKLFRRRTSALLLSIGGNAFEIDIRLHLNNEEAECWQIMALHSLAMGMPWHYIPHKLAHLKGRVS